MLDLSDDALDLTRENMTSLGLSCTLTKADMLALETLPCDIIVSNPPYIRTNDISGLDSNVKDYEPYTALDGGIDGLIFYRALGEFANNSLSEKGAIVVETGYDLHEDVADIFRPHFKDITILKDFMDIYRVVIAKR
jgi:release factor glutamine methyltransferase